MVRNVVYLLFLCLVVGVVVSIFDVDPMRILTNTWGAIRDIGRLLRAAVDWAVPYILTGAVIVLPIAAIAFLMRRLRKRA
jgi:hypothetical protein